MIKKCFLEAEKEGSAVPVIQLKDSIRRISEGQSEGIDRSNFRIVQTPQVFDLASLRSAYEQPYREQFTDDASVMESAGKKIHLVEGEPENIKLTTQIDLKLAEWLLR